MASEVKNSREPITAPLKNQYIFQLHSKFLIFYPQISVPPTLCRKKNLKWVEIITKIYSWIKSRQQLIVWFLSSIDIFKIQPLHQNSGKLRKDVKIIIDDQSIQFKLVSSDKKKEQKVGGIGNGFWWS